MHKLRDYLNTASEYENLRESTRRYQHPYPSVANHANGVPWVAAADAEAVEDADGDVIGGFDGTELDADNATAVPPPPPPAPVAPPGHMLPIIGQAPSPQGTPESGL